MKIKGIQKVFVEGEFNNVTEFHKQFPCSTISEIDGVNADYMCESCEKALPAGTMGYVWDDLVYTCLDCGGADKDHKIQVL